MFGEPVPAFARMVHKMSLQATALGHQVQQARQRQLLGKESSGDVQVQHQFDEYDPLIVEKAREYVPVSPCRLHVAYRPCSSARSRVVAVVVQHAGIAMAQLQGPTWSGTRAGGSDASRGDVAVGPAPAAARSPDARHARVRYRATSGCHTTYTFG